MTKPESQKSKDARAASFAEFLQSDVPPDQAAEFAQAWRESDKKDAEELASELVDVESSPIASWVDVAGKKARVKDLEAQIVGLVGKEDAEIIIRQRREAKAAQTPQAVPVVQPEAHAATALRETPMSRAGLVKAHIHHWPTIDADLKDAASNGLSAAKAGKRSWSESKALEWARAKGKLTDQPGASSQPSIADPMAAHYGQLVGLPRQTHTL